MNSAESFGIQATVIRQAKQKVPQIWNLTYFTVFVSISWSLLPRNTDSKAGCQPFKGRGLDYIVVFFPKKMVVKPPGGSQQELGSSAEARPRFSTRPLLSISWIIVQGRGFITLHPLKTVPSSLQLYIMEVIQKNQPACHLLSFLPDPGS